VPLTSELPSGKKGRRSLWAWVGGIVLLLFVVLSIAVAIVISHAEPILRARVIETLSARFKSKVELAKFHVSISNGVQVSGEGLRIYGRTDPNTHQPGVQPLIAIGEFRFATDWLNLLRSPMHVQTVYLKGMQLNVPPREDRQQIKNMRSSAGRTKIIVDQFICEGAELVINTSRPGKLPLEFEIGSLKMKRTGAGKPLHFDAILINPKPMGIITSNGVFGPWREDSPRDTPVQGTYSFNKADLSTIKGIAGILSSTGQYGGTLDQIVVNGKTDTPDFRLAVSGHSVPLQTEFHAIVDGTSGDTYLQPVRAKILHTSLTAKGYVVRVQQPSGHRHHVELDVAIDKGRIEDLLKLGVRTDPPVMTGELQLNTKLDLVPGEADIAKRIKLVGSFRVLDTHFTNDKIQGKVDALSLRSRGRPELAADNIPDNVHSELMGNFVLSSGILSFSWLHFEVPGAQVHLAGKYSLDGNEFDFHGKARMQAKLSHMVMGWKSVLLKPVDPFFSKNGAGTDLPVKITGTRAEPHVGLDFGHKPKEKRSEANAEVPHTR
jgi:hypothetical protein